jgi:hypothetical protein
VNHRQLSGLLTLACVVVAAFAGCVSVPSALAPAVNESADDYAQAINDFSDKALLSNVLRARDFAPLNFSDLSSITGSVALQASVGLNVPFGAAHGSSVRSAATAGVQETASPVLTLGTLNTQGFMMTMIQPVSPAYVLSKWNSGYDKQFLLYLFVKSVSFAQSDTPILNDPDRPENMARFVRLINDLSYSEVDLKTISLLDPIGRPFPIGFLSKNETVTKNGANPTQTITTSSDVAAMTFLNTINDGQLHTGNAPCPTPGQFGCAQLYKQYPGQVVLCVNAEFDPENQTYRFGEHVVTAPPESAARKNAEAAKTPEQISRLRAAPTLKSIQLATNANADNGALAGQNAPGTTSASAVGGNGTANSGNNGNMLQMGMALQPGRVSAILTRADCGTDEIVLSPEPEELLAASTQKFAHIQWRSIAEIIQYLGAIARQEGNPQQIPYWTHAGNSERETVFTLNEGAAGRISVRFRGKDYAVPGETKDEAPHDHGLQALSILNELISTAKISGNLPVTQTLQVVP